MTHSEMYEQNLLKGSAYAAVAFAVISFILGLLLRSQVILFDGLYSIISVILSFLTLSAFKFMNKADFRRFPFGKETIEPLIIIIKYFSMIALITGSFIAAVIALFQGGRPVPVGAGLAYAAFASLFCFAVYRYFVARGKKINSNLLRAEANEWYLDTMVSLGVLIGFLIAFFLQFIPALEAFIVYVDPVMMMVISFYFIKWPLIEIRHSMRELLEMRPADGTSEVVEKTAKAIEEREKLEESFIRVTKVAKTLWVEIDFVVGPDGSVQTIDDQDRIREELEERLKDLPLEKRWLTVSFTNNRKWAL
ncbi:cation diffusion facilitator family transporter [Salipaludibacillus aurantiacus]|uniref:Cation diffusion facilitator family transporter n=1 Tax=Salipaludibacillus aurantiacus TaxID=1601833 RepID=A0A1H9UN88_9BACI|nr:cation diffusion facilitator family transporter [Salipaludibacillus aurantiacus]SES10980.1 cation diffusion facilitator family transporter [Salipaludibacillus aurantiacus]